MEIMINEMRKHLEQLKIGYEKQIANIHAQEGAIQECEMWIKIMEADGLKSVDDSEVSTTVT